MTKGTGQILSAAIFVLYFLSSVAQADERQRLYRSAYFLGRGDTGIATADNHEALYYNPAGLAYGNGLYKETVLLSPHLEISSDTKNLIREMVSEKQQDPKTLAQHEGKNQHLGLYNFSGIIFRRVALGAVASNQNNILIKKSPDDAGLSMVEANTVANRVISFGLAEAFFGGSLLLGSHFKYINRDDAEISVRTVDSEDVNDDLKDDNILNSTTGGGFDVGLMYRTEGRAPLSLGLTIENVGDTVLKGVTEDDETRTLKQVVNAGFAIEPGTKFSRVGLFLDIRDIFGLGEPNVFKRIHIGSEIAFKQFTGITAGLNQGYATMGFYLNLYFLRFDIGMYSEEMGDRVGTRGDERYYFRLMAGF